MSKGKSIKKKTIRGREVIGERVIDKEAREERRQEVVNGPKPADDHARQILGIIRAFEGQHKTMVPESKKLAAYLAVAFSGALERGVIGYHHAFLDLLELFFKERGSKVDELALRDDLLEYLNRDTSQEEADPECKKEEKPAVSCQRCEHRRTEDITGYRCGHPSHPPHFNTKLEAENLIEKAPEWCPL